MNVTLQRLVTMREALATMTEDQLDAATREAEQLYTSMSLWSSLPRDMQGATDNAAWDVRADWRNAAEALWLAAKKEWNYRMLPTFHERPAAG